MRTFIDKCLESLFVATPDQASSSDRAMKTTVWAMYWSNVDPNIQLNINPCLASQSAALYGATLSQLIVVELLAVVRLAGVRCPRRRISAKNADLNAECSSL